MSALFFLLRRRTVNWFKSFIRQPSQFIPILIMVLVVGLNFFRPSTDGVPVGSAGNLFFTDLAVGIARLAALAVASFMILSTIVSTVDKGMQLFSRADVDYLFTSPIARPKVLVYGVSASIKTIFLVLFIMLFQIPNLTNAGIPLPRIAALIVAVSLQVFCGIALSLFFYVLSRRHRELKLPVQIFLYALPLVTLAGMIFPYVAELIAGDVGAVMAGAGKVTWVEWIPLVGWGQGVLTGIMYGAEISHWVQAALLVVTSLLSVLYAVKTDVNFYEEALVASDRLEQKKAELGIQSNGIFQQQTRMWNPDKASRFIDKENLKSGLGRGWGVSSIFWRQMREERRRRPFVIGPNTIFLLLAAVILSLVAKNLSPAIKLAIMSGLIWYDMIFFSTVSSFQMELERDDFYYYPGSAAGKITAASLPGIIARLIDFWPALLVLVLWIRAPFLPSLLLFPYCLSMVVVMQFPMALGTLMTGGQNKTMVYKLITGLISFLTTLPSIAGIVMLPIFSEIPNLAHLAAVPMLVVLVINFALGLLNYPVGISLLKRGRG